MFSFYNQNSIKENQDLAAVVQKGKTEYKQELEGLKCKTRCDAEQKECH